AKNGNLHRLKIIAVDKVASDDRSLFSWNNGPLIQIDGHSAGVISQRNAESEAGGLNFGPGAHTARKLPVKVFRALCIVARPVRSAAVRPYKKTCQSKRKSSRIGRSVPKSRESAKAWLAQLPRTMPDAAPANARSILSVSI